MVPSSQRKVPVNVNSGQSYKQFMLVNYNSRVVPDWKIPPFYDPIVVIYERKMFIRLATVDYFFNTTP